MKLPLPMVNKETLAEVAENLMIGQALIYDYAYEHSTRSVLLLECHDDSVELSLTKMHGNAYDVPDNELLAMKPYAGQVMRMRMRLPWMTGLIKTKAQLLMSF
jgi:hypothetical protein